MNYLDYIIIVILLIIAAIGLIRGFFKQIIGFLSVVVSVLVAYLLCATVGDLIINATGIDDAIVSGIKGAIGEVWNTEKSVSEVSEFISSQNWPTFLSDAIVNAVNSLNTATVNFADIAATTIARYIIVVGTFVVLLIATRLVMILVGKILSFIIKRTPLKIVDAILGLVLGLLEGATFVYLGLYVLDLLTVGPLSGFKEVLDASVLAQFFLKYNLFGLVIGG